MLVSTALSAQTPQMPPQQRGQQPQPSNGGTRNSSISNSISPATKREGTAVSSLHSLSDDDDDDDELDSDYRGGGEHPGPHGSDGKPTRKRKRKGLGNWTRTTLACVRCRKMKIRVSLPSWGRETSSELKTAVRRCEAVQ
jgi:hypothetical protein